MIGQLFTAFFDFLGFVIEWLVIIAEQALVIYTFYGLLSVFLDRKLRRSTRIVLSFCCYALLLAALFGLPLYFSSAGSTASSESSAQYVSSVNSDKYHIITCRHAENILAENRVYYATSEKAEADGKTPCSVCHPDS